ncbi:hypothetical protein E6R60_26415 [Streptomyces sp. A0642]|uniref:hypothetical protein n=1 Tax=Streptomyces sp. A0642 TaxID=2563100 RepID=UPI0010A22B4B|nr:hypothetical protein [Streptomyces sp. A0642]THA72467.1 hypothetical protein E6R60_26415 [Streptomyces sp. A0642]
MSVPIIGQSQSQPDRFDREYGGVHLRSETAQGDVLDTEILELEAVLKDMQDRYSAKAFELTSFTREVKERCHTLGFAVDVRWMTVADGTGRILEGVRSPEIEIVGRVEKKAFDHDQKVHEVTHNILDLDEAPGIIKSEGARGGHPH